MLVILSGLPGTGKTTIARVLCRRLGAFHLRIDTIEQALAAAAGPDHVVGAAGYIIGYRLAEDNLRMGASVVADSVNPLAITRQGWRAVAASADVEALEVEVLCSDRAEHRHRVETRHADIEGHVLPRWSDVENREYEPWHAPTLTVDTARHTADECAGAIVHALKQRLRKNA